MNHFQYHEKAKKLYENDSCKISILEKPIVSPIEEERGAYVLAWVWVPDDPEPTERTEG